MRTYGRRSGWRGVLLGMVGTALAGLLTPSVQAAEAPLAPPLFKARAVELIAARSGRILFSSHADQPQAMASVTKLMTLYLAVKALERHQIGLDSLVPVTEQAYRIGGSQIWLEPGERLTVDQMLKAIAVGSANDAAYALGEYLAGSSPAFVADMNRTALKLGMRHTHFSNPHGLNAPEHYTTAHDLGILAERAVRSPILLHYTSMWQDRSLRNGKGGNLWLINHNRLLRQYAGCDGLKTGYTRQAGFCIVATALRGGTRMIAVVMGAPSAAARNAAASNLMTWGFQHFRTVAYARRAQIVARVKVTHGARGWVDAVTPHSAFVTVGSGEADSLRIVRHIARDRRAPVQAGQRLGEVTVSVSGRVFATTPVVSASTVRAVGMPELIWRYWARVAG
ncbi:MAG: D-alanyl-D-alanine carboxypeptidase [Thermaerobacter sp.]|nr:D-alanyl-D-alanine carboxypeptidase [Thermaerobacter sp.]